MMSTTHAAVGLLLAIPVSVAVPELALVAALAALAGGVFPDIDLFVGTHRKTLHFPVYYWVAALPIAAVAVASPSAVTVGSTVFLLSAALHSVADWFGAGDELRPWERTSERAVYVHPLGRWLTPRYLVRYDGAPEDLLLTLVLSVPGLLLFDGRVRVLVLFGVVVAVVYAALRKQMPELVGY
ncbi:MAG: metal-dependent hydrolase [Halobacteriota archaeon]